jgi:pyridoxamine 5'-phosphate oxidase
MARFTALFARAAEKAPFDHTAATLATAGTGCAPSARIVLVRTVDERGFVFFTNYQSRKAREIEQNAAAALCFYWPWLDEQVRAEGRLEKVSAEESDRYFATRPRGSQIGAWASAQSEPLASRSDLEARYFDVERQYEGTAVPRPPHWGGYRLTPDRIEFWKAGQYRLHDRVVYTRTADGWETQTLNP